MKDPVFETGINQNFDCSSCLVDSVMH